MKTPENFMKAYNKLCKVMGFELVASPEFRLRDDGTYSVVIKYTIREYKG
jgi:hypothetical protein